MSHTVTVPMEFVLRTPEGPIRSTVDLHVTASYQPHVAADLTDPGSPEGFEISEITWSDGKTPVALSDQQIDRLEEIMLANVHAEEEYERDEKYHARYTD